jgi:large subunit ribosomal protein L2
MAVKTYRPTTPSRRRMTSMDTSELSKQRPVKSLVLPKRRTNGRNQQGKVTVRHRGGGAKRLYRVIDFKFNLGQKGTVKALQYDPNRSANIALVELSDGHLIYLLAGSGVKVGDKISSDSEADIRSGNRLPLRNIPVGTQIHNIELVLGKGGALARSAGAKAQLVAKEDEFCQVKLPSGEVRLVHQNCLATIGAVGNEGYQNVKYGGAGRQRHLGRRPTVRGKAMNPVDHGMGGGEGQTGPGRHPVTPWGKPALGLKTRRRKLTNASIIRPRKAGRRG